MELSWTEIDRDVYGKPLDVSFYDIFRATARNLTNEGLVLIGEVRGSLCRLDRCRRGRQPDDVRLSRACAHLRRHSWRVGLGISLRAPVLRIGKSQAVPGGIVLEWDAVERTLTGGAAQIVGYRVYASDTPFRHRADPRR